MRILFLIDRVLPVGASGIAVLQVKKASDAGHHTTLLTTFESRLDSTLQACLDDVIFVAGMGNSKVHNLEAELENVVRDLAHRVDFGSYDIVISHNFGRFGGPRILKLACQQSPLILWCHDEYPWAGYHYEFQNHAGELIRTFEPWDEGRIGAAAHLSELADLRQAIFVSPSLWLHQRVAAVVASCKGIVPVHMPNGIDLEEFSSGSTFAPFEKTGSGLRILLIGTLGDARKNIIYGLKELGEALSPQQAAMCEIVHVGGNPDRYKTPELIRATALRETSAFLRNNGVPGHIVSALYSAGLVNSQHAIATLMRGAEIVIHLSQAENFPTVCLEARAAGASVVASDAGGTRETLGPDDFLVPLPLEEGAIAPILSQLIESHGDPVLNIPAIPEISLPVGNTTVPPVTSVNRMWAQLEELVSAATGAPCNSQWATT